MIDDPDLSAEPDETLAALADAGGGEGLISARQDHSDMLVTQGPDVLWTPRGGGKVPVAYSVIAYMDSSIRLSRSVRNNGNYDFQLNSRTTDIIGHEPGTLKGVVVPGYKTYSHARVGADYVFSEGFANVSHQDPAWINHPDPGPDEPQREMSDSFVADISQPVAAAPTTSPYGTLPEIGPGSGPVDPGTDISPNPTGPPQSFSPTGPGTDLHDPNTFSPLTPQQQQRQFDSWLNGVRKALKKKHARRRGGHASNRSQHPANAHGRTTINATFDTIAPSLMAELMQRYGFTTDEAAGWVGNLGYESTGFTAGAEGHPISGRGGAGYGQWTGGRRIQFEKYIKQHTGHDATNADYTNYNLNVGYLEQEMDGRFAGAVRNTLTQSTSLPASTQEVYAHYETPADYLDGSNASYPPRVVYAERARTDYLNSRRPTVPRPTGDQ